MNVNMKTEMVMDVEEIGFNSKSKKYSKLSNFYGGVEGKYMRERFEDKEMFALFDKFEECSVEEFQEFLKKLQPNKKDWTEGKLNYWMRDGEPIRGILSQLVGSSVRDTSVGKKRIKILKEMTGLKEIKIKDDTSDEEKKELMLRLLREKFRNEEYRQELISTGDAILHEKPLQGRGEGNNWTYKDGYGKDWLGQLLMIVRDEVRQM